MEKIQLRLTQHEAELVLNALASQQATSTDDPVRIDASHLHMWLKYRIDSFWGSDGTRRNPGGRPRQSQRAKETAREANQ